MPKPCQETFQVAFFKGIELKQLFLNLHLIFKLLLIYLNALIFEKEPFQMIIWL